MPGSNPLANILVVLLGAIVIGVAIVLGFFAFLVLSAIVLVAAAALAVRVWWAKRHLPPNAGSDNAPTGDLIEGEFHVVKEDKNS
jgi:membrane protein implicated in regulation of membrane protease activity